MARRVQHKRGQPKPPNTVLVKRPYRFGNPFSVADHGQRGAVDLHAAWVIDPQSQPIRCGKKTYRPSTAEEIREKLGGRDAGCNCDLDQPCHADTLLAIANRPAVTP